MSTLRKLMYPAFFATLVVALVGGFDGNASSDDDKQPPPPVAKAKPEVSEAGPKSPPPAAAPTQTFKLISMAEAVTLAEKAGKGYTLKAERTERPVVGYRVEVVGMDGNRTVVELSGDGNVLSRKAPTPGGMAGGQGKKKTDR